MFSKDERENYVGGCRAAMERQLVLIQSGTQEREAIVVICKLRKQTACLLQPQNKYSYDI